MLRADVMRGSLAGALAGRLPFTWAADVPHPHIRPIDLAWAEASDGPVRPPYLLAIVRQSPETPPPPGLGPEGSTDDSIARLLRLRIEDPDAPAVTVLDGTTMLDHAVTLAASTNPLRAPPAHCYVGITHGATLDGEQRCTWSIEKRRVPSLGLSEDRLFPPRGPSDAFASKSHLYRLAVAAGGDRVYGVGYVAGTRVLSFREFDFSASPGSLVGRVDFPNALPHDPDLAEDCSLGLLALSVCPSDSGTIAAYMAGIAAQEIPDEGSNAGLGRAAYIVAVPRRIGLGVRTSGWRPPCHFVRLTAQAVGGGEETGQLAINAVREVGGALYACGVTDSADAERRGFLLRFEPDALARVGRTVASLWCAGKPSWFRDLTMVRGAPVSCGSVGTDRREQVAVASLPSPASATLDAWTVPLEPSVPAGQAYRGWSACSLHGQVYVGALLVKAGAGGVSGFGIARPNLRMPRMDLSWARRAVSLEVRSAS